MSKTTFFTDAFDPSGLIAAERLSHMPHITRGEPVATLGLSRDAVSKSARLSSHLNKPEPSPDQAATPQDSQPGKRLPTGRPTRSGEQDGLQHQRNRAVSCPLITRPESASYPKSFSNLPAPQRSWNLMY